MGFDRLLIIDASLSTLLAGKLRDRGRNSKSLAEVGDKHAENPDLLEFLGDQFPEAVLVTADDHMPSDHADAVADNSSTLAVVDPLIKPPYDPDQEVEEWRREIVHRWAHRMETLELGQVRRYSLNRSGPWKQPRRIRTKIQTAKQEKGKGALPSEPVGLQPPRPSRSESANQESFDFDFDEPLDTD